MIPNQQIQTPNEIPAINNNLNMTFVDSLSLSLCSPEIRILISQKITTGYRLPYTDIYNMSNGKCGGIYP